MNNEQWIMNMESILRNIPKLSFLFFFFLNFFFLADVSSSLAFDSSLKTHLCSAGLFGAGSLLASLRGCLVTFPCSAFPLAGTDLLSIGACSGFVGVCTDCFVESWFSFVCLGSSTGFWFSKTFFWVTGDFWIGTSFGESDLAGITFICSTCLVEIVFDSTLLTFGGGGGGP